MVLVIDCGNTDTVLGLFKGSIQKHIWRMPSSDALNQQIWSYRIASEFLEARVKTTDIERVVLSSVVPDLTAKIAAALGQLTDKPLIVVNTEIYDQLNIEVINKIEIGADLVANAVAAYDFFKQKCVVVDFGTALTFTSILDNGQLAGVAIAPGLKTAVKSLLQHTAQLPQVPLEVPKSALGKNTIEAIQAGVAMGYTGMVRYLLEKIKAELGADTKVIGTGGLVDILEDLDGVFDEKNRLLTLEGLVLIGKQVGNS